MWGQIAYDWKTIESPRRSAGTFTLGADENTGVPPIRISPDAGFSSPAIARSVVVLPHPDGPSKVRCSPAPTVNVTPRTATTPPYRTTRSRTSIDARAIVTRPQPGPRAARPRTGEPAPLPPPGSAEAPSPR